MSAVDRNKVWAKVNWYRKTIVQKSARDVSRCRKARQFGIEFPGNYTKCKLHDEVSSEEQG